MLPYAQLRDVSDCHQCMQLCKHGVVMADFSIVMSCAMCLQEELVFHILQSEAKDLKTFIRLTLQQQAGISTSSKRSAKQV